MRDSSVSPRLAGQGGQGDRWTSLSTVREVDLLQSRRRGKQQECGERRKKRDGVKDRDDAVE